MFSAYWRCQDNGWMATHRLPLDSAIYYCKQYKVNDPFALVAIVPDHADPAPYLRLVEQFA